MKQRSSGFTLIELLIVIAVIAILAGAVFLALNPARQFAQARNSQRTTHTRAILNAIDQNGSDNKGVFTCAGGDLPSTSTAMASSGGYNICSCLVPTYVASMPFDPSAAGAHYTSCSDYTTGYNILQDASSSRITISAPSAELGQSISAQQ